MAKSHHNQEQYQALYLLCAGHNESTSHTDLTSSSPQLREEVRISHLTGRKLAMRGANDSLSFHRDLTDTWVWPEHSPLLSQSQGLLLSAFGSSPSVIYNPCLLRARTKSLHISDLINFQAGLVPPGRFSDCETTLPIPWGWNSQALLCLIGQAHQI